MNPTQKKVAIGIGIGLAIFGGLKLKKEIDRAKMKKEIRDFKKGNVGSININEVVKQLGQDFGFEYAAIDPRHWTENDTAIIETLNEVGKKIMPQVEQAYLKKYSRNLQADCQKYLGDDYKKVSYLFTGLPSEYSQKNVSGSIDSALDVLKKYGVKVR